MNPKLALPLVLTIFAFGFTFQQMQSRSDDTALGAMDSGSGYSMYSDDETGAQPASNSSEPDTSERKMLSAEEVKQKVSTLFKSRDDNYRAFSRVAVERAELTSVEIYSQTLPTDPYFLGSMKVKSGVRTKSAAIQVDRFSGRVLLFLNSEWRSSDALGTTQIFNMVRVVDK